MRMHKSPEHTQPNDFEIAENLLEGMEYPFDQPEVIETFISVARQLKENLGDYEALIGDDASGRLPTRVIRTLINEMRKRKEGEDSIPTYFLPGLTGDQHYEEPSRKQKEFLQKHGLSGKKILFMTEYIGTGATMENFTRVCDEAGVECDIAALTAHMDAGSYARHTNAPYIGKENSSVGMDYFHAGLRSMQNREISGVIKTHSIDEGAEDAQHRVKDVTAKRSELANQKAIKRSREDAQKLGMRLYSLLFEEQS